jgi:hypothetical protein
MDTDPAAAQLPPELLRALSAHEEALHVHTPDAGMVTQLNAPTGEAIRRLWEGETHLEVLLDGNESSLTFEFVNAVLERAR